MQRKVLPIGRLPWNLISYLKITVRFADSGQLFFCIFTVFVTQFICCTTKQCCYCDDTAYIGYRDKYHTNQSFLHIFLFPDFYVNRACTPWWKVTILPFLITPILSISSQLQIVKLFILKIASVFSLCKKLSDYLPFAKFGWL